MMVKSGVEEIFLKFLYVQAIFKQFFYLIERKIFVQNYKFSNKNNLPCAWRDFEKKSLWCMINETLCHTFHSYSILTGQTMVESESYCVLKRDVCTKSKKWEAKTIMWFWKLKFHCIKFFIWLSAVHTFFIFAKFKNEALSCRFEFIFVIRSPFLREICNVQSFFFSFFLLI